MKYHLIFFLCLPAFAAPQKDVEEARHSIESLIQPLLPGLQKTEKPKILSDFRVDGCEKHKVNWMNVLLMKEKVTLDYRFKDGCDIQGSVEPKVFQTFPVKLDLRHLEKFTQVVSQNRITSTIESKPVLKLDMTSGELMGPKGKVKFEADYEVKIDPLKGKTAVEKNLGGEIRISEIYGEKVSIKEKIMVK